MLLSAILLVVGLNACSGYGSSPTTVGETTVGETTVSETTTTTDPIAEALAFPIDDYTVQTKNVGTEDGMVSITYNLYRHLTYVARPVDPNYQSLDIAVPVKIDGVDIDATNAPMLFDITVGDYLASPNRRPVSSTTTTSTTISTTTTEDAAVVESTTTTILAPPGSKGTTTGNADQALAAGYVVVSPGCRGSDNISRDGAFFGKAPAAIVDLKCAVKYLRFNDDVIPGDSNRIVSTGASAGGGLSALLGASGNSELYQPYFDELGAADASDAIFASAVYCPVTDLAHADGAYEWQFGTTPFGSSLVDQALSAQLASSFAAYLTSLDLVGRGGYGTLNAEDYMDYIVNTYLLPPLREYLSSLTEIEVAAYLASHPWIEWDGSAITIAWADFVNYVGRSKGLPAYDSFDLTTPEVALFGDADTEARHFTEFSLRQTGEADSPALDPNLEPPSLDPALLNIVDLVNPMYFIGENNTGCVRYWWMRQGTADSETSLPIFVNLATALENLGKEVNAALYWDVSDCANQDPVDFVEWIEFITTSGG